MDLGQYNIKTKIVQYDFTILSSAEKAKELTDKLDEATLGLDIGILVNNVGMAWAGPYHTQPIQKIFDMLYVNCASQAVLSRYYLEKWVNERKGKKCAIISYSSIAAQEPMGGVAEYGATKAFNDIFSRSMEVEYKQGKDVDLDVLTVYPASVKSQMNSGRYTFTVSSQQHAKSVIDSLGWDSVTQGHIVHGFQHFMKSYEPFYSINKYINYRRRMAFMKEQQAKR